MQFGREFYASSMHATNRIKLPACGFFMNPLYLLIQRCKLQYSQVSCDLLELGAEVIAISAEEATEASDFWFIFTFKAIGNPGHDIEHARYKNIRILKRRKLFLINPGSDAVLIAAFIFQIAKKAGLPRAALAKDNMIIIRSCLMRSGGRHVDLRNSTRLWTCGLREEGKEISD